MTSVPAVSIPASGVSARPSVGFDEGPRARGISPAEPARERRPEDGGREHRPDTRPTPVVGPARGLLAATVIANAPVDEPAAPRGPLERASDAYRKAGAEPPRYSEEPRLFSVSA